MIFTAVYKSFISDTALYELFDMLCDAGRIESTFHDGEVQTHHDFRNLVRREDLHFWLCMGDAVPLGLLWITDLRYGIANVHFAMLGTAHPRTDLRCAKAIFIQILSLQDDEGNYLLHALHGLTPLRNKQACRFAKAVGFEMCGEVQKAVWMKDTGQLEGAMISELTREKATRQKENEVNT